MIKNVINWVVWYHDPSSSSSLNLKGETETFVHAYFIGIRN